MKKSAIILISSILFFACREDSLSINESKNLPIKSETLSDWETGELYEIINYRYNSLGQLINKTIEYKNDSLANTEFTYLYNNAGQLIKIIRTQTGWTDEIQPIKEDAITNIYYEGDLKLEEVSYIDSLNRGYERKQYYYSQNLLDSIVHSSYSVRQDLFQSHTEYFFYSSGKLVERGYFKDEKRDYNTHFEYSGDKIIEEKSHNWRTIHEYESGLLSTSTLYFSDGTPSHISDFEYDEQGVLQSVKQENYSVYCGPDITIPCFITLRSYEYFE